MKTLSQRHKPTHDAVEHARRTTCTAHRTKHYYGGFTRARMTDDLAVVPPGWAQPQYQQRTNTLLTNTVAAAFWNNRVSDDLLFGDLVIILLPDNCCSQQYTHYARTVKDLDPLLHEVLQHAAATVWDTIQQAETHELLPQHNFLHSWTQTPLTPLHIPPLLHTILVSLGRNKGSLLGGHVGRMRL